jgi:hypothetical protein
MIYLSNNTSTLFLILILLSCSTLKNVGYEKLQEQEEIRIVNVTILEITEFKNSFLLTGYDRTSDTEILIVSLKHLTSYDSKSQQKLSIKIGNSYEFKLKYPRRIGVYQMQELGVYLQIENEVVWTGRDKNDVPFISQNSQGLVIVVD